MNSNRGLRSPGYFSAISLLGKLLLYVKLREVVHIAAIIDIQ